MLSILKCLDLSGGHAGFDLWRTTADTTEVGQSGDALHLTGRSEAR